MVTLETLDKARAALSDVVVLAKAQVQGYTRADGVTVQPHSDSRAPAKAKPQGGPPPIGKHAAALKKTADNHYSDSDKFRLSEAADHMKSGNHEGLKRVLGNADTHQRETILEHVHPDHWESLGSRPMNKKDAVARHERRFGGAK